MSEASSLLSVTNASLTVIERRAKLAESLGTDFRISMPADYVHEFVKTARLVLAFNEAGAVIERSLRFKWAAIWFVIGLLTGMGAR